jgi:hypothetical protein
MKTTKYFESTRQKAGRSVIQDAWIQRVVDNPAQTAIQADGRIRVWGKVPEMQNRYLRVILPGDGETIHNAFFDPRFVP